MYICDLSEQKQPFGCTLTNPPHVTPLRPGSTFIDGFSRAIYQKIADFNSYPLRYQYWKSVNNCGVGTQWRNVWWIRQGTPKRLLLLGAVTYIQVQVVRFIFRFPKYEKLQEIFVNRHKSVTVMKGSKSIKAKTHTYISTKYIVLKKKEKKNWGR